MFPAHVDFTSTSDVLGRHPQLDHRVTVPVLGVRTRFSTNSRYVGELVEEAFGAWRNIPETLIPASPSLDVRIVVRQGAEHGGTGPSPVSHLCPDATRLIALSAGSVAISDPARLESFAYVTPDLAADREHFRANFLEAMTLSLVSHFDRHPVHAAAIGRDGRAVVLAGTSGVGKSTLACVAQAAGYDVIAEDRVWVQLDPVVQLWGWPGAFRLEPQVVANMASLSDRFGTPTEDGKLAFPIAAAPDRSHLVARAAGVCVLSRGSHASLERVPAEALERILAEQLAPGFDRFRQRHGAVIGALAQSGAWHLNLSGDPLAAVPLIQRMLHPES